MYRWMICRGGGANSNGDLASYCPASIFYSFSNVSKTVASSLEVVRPYCVVITTTPTFSYSLVHKCGTAIWPYRLLYTGLNVWYNRGSDGHDKPLPTP